MSNVLDTGPEASTAELAAYKGLVEELRALDKEREKHWVTSARDVQIEGYRVRVSVSPELLVCAYMSDILHVVYVIPPGHNVRYLHPTLRTHIAAASTLVRTAINVLKG